MFLNDTRVINITIIRNNSHGIIYLAKLHTRFDVKINKMKYIETYLVSVIRKFINFISNRERKILTRSQRDLLMEIPHGIFNKLTSLITSFLLPHNLSRISIFRMLRTTIVSSFLFQVAIRRARGKVKCGKGCAVA